MPIGGVSCRFGEALLKEELSISELLAESVSDARERESRAFDSVAGDCAHRVVLYGAGNLGRKVLRLLRTQGVEPLAFVDAAPGKAGSQVDGITVFTIDDALHRFADNAAFVICVWNPELKGGVQGVIDRLRAGGALRVAPFLSLFWKYPDLFLPYYLWDLPSKLLAERESIAELNEALDPSSRPHLARELRLRLHGDFRQLQVPRAERQYFPRDLFDLHPDECFVDCGAYDGDTLRALVEETSGSFGRAICFEADPDNCARLRHFVAAHPELARRVVIHEAAVSRNIGVLRFAATAAPNAAASVSGDVVVDCTSLDTALAGETPTFIKMDIEGSELDALEGAAATISSCDPLLAVCVYHQPAHLWQIPLWLKANRPGSTLVINSYAVDGFDSVCIAVPPHRRKHAAAA